MNTNEIHSSHEDMFAAIYFYIDQMKRTWRSVAAEAGVDFHDLVRILRDGDYTDDEAERVLWQLAAALGMGMEEIATFKARHANSSPGSHKHRYYVGWLVRKWILFRQPPLHHRQRMIDWCCELARPTSSWGHAEAARSKPPRKVIDVAFEYERKLKERGFFAKGGGV